MTKYILHGGCMRVDNTSNRNFFRELTKDLKKNSKILIICFAREKGEDLEIFERDKKNILKNSDNKNLEFLMASENNFIEQAREADLILLEGGDTAKLLKTLKLYPNFIKNIHNKVVAGSSAGAYILSKYFYSNTTDKIFEGLGVLPIRTICHYNGNKKIIGRINKYPNEFELIVLKDYEYKVFQK